MNSDRAAIIGPAAGQLESVADFLVGLPCDRFQLLRTNRQRRFPRRLGNLGFRGTEALSFSTGIRSG